jgi:hypothetical protein
MNRRDFLKGSAVAAALALAPSPLLADPIEDCWTIMWWEIPKTGEPIFHSHYVYPTGETYGDGVELIPFAKNGGYGYGILVGGAMAIQIMPANSTSGITLLRAIHTRMTPAQIQIIKDEERKYMTVEYNPTKCKLDTRDPTDAEIAACPIAQPKKA